MRLAFALVLLSIAASPAMAVEYDGPFCVHLPGFNEFGDPVDAYKLPQTDRDQQPPLDAAAERLKPVPRSSDVTPAWNRELGWVHVPQTDVV